MSDLPPPPKPTALDLGGEARGGTRPSKRVPHHYAFRFERRGMGQVEFADVYNWDWRRALTQALTEVAVRTKTNRSRWRMTMMEES